MEPFVRPTILEQIICLERYQQMEVQNHGTITPKSYLVTKIIQTWGSAWVSVLVFPFYYVYVLLFGCVMFGECLIREMEKILSKKATRNDSILFGRGRKM